MTTKRKTSRGANPTVRVENHRCKEQIAKLNRLVRRLQVGEQEGIVK